MKVSKMPQRFIKINQLKPFKRNVNIKALVMEIGETREGTSKRTGEPFKLTEVKLGDDTAIVMATVWGDTINNISEGNTYEFIGVSTTLFQGSLRVNINNRTKIRESETPIDKNSVNTKRNMSTPRRR